MYFCSAGTNVCKLAFTLKRNEAQWFVLISAGVLYASIIIAYSTVWKQKTRSAHLRRWRWRLLREGWPPLLALSAPCFLRRRPSVRCCGSVWRRRDSLLSGKAPADPPPRLTPDLPAAASNSQPHIPSPSLPPSSTSNSDKYLLITSIPLSPRHYPGTGRPSCVRHHQSRFKRVFKNTRGSKNLGKLNETSLRLITGWPLYPGSQRCCLCPRRTRWSPAPSECLSRYCRVNKRESFSKHKTKCAEPFPFILTVILHLQILYEVNIKQICSASENHNGPYFWGKLCRTVLDFRIWLDDESYLMSCRFFEIKVCNKLCRIISISIDYNMA